MRTVSPVCTPAFLRAAFSPMASAMRWKRCTASSRSQLVIAATRSALVPRTRQASSSQVMVKALTSSTGRKTLTSVAAGSSLGKLASISATERSISLIPSPVTAEMLMAVCPCAFIACSTEGQSAWAWGRSILFSTTNWGLRASSGSKRASSSLMLS